MTTRSKVPKKKSQTGKSSKKEEEEKRLGFFYVLAVALIVFAVCSFLYYNFQDKIPYKIPMIGDKGDTVRMRLYFGHAKSKHLVKEERQMSAAEEISLQAKEVILELIKGPTPPLTKTIPPGTRLLDLSIDRSRTAYVDLSSDLIEKHTGGSSAELLTVYSIVNSLTLNFNEIDKVQILVEGKRVDTIAGHIFAGIPLKSNLQMVGN